MNEDIDTSTTATSTPAKKGGRGKKPAKAEGQVASIIQPKNPGQWGALLNEVSKEHWRTLRVVIQFNDKLLGGKPKALKVAEAMLKARGLEDQIAAFPADQPERGVAADHVAANDGLCEFHRRHARSGEAGTEGNET